MDGDLSLSCTTFDHQDGPPRRRARSLAVLLAMSVLFGAVSGGAGTPSPQNGTVEGVISLVWGDGSRSDRRSAGPIPLLTDSVGHVVELVLTEAQTAPLGGLLALNGKRVIVNGSWAAAPSVIGSRTVLEVGSVFLVEEQAPSQPAVVSGPQPWVSILCKFSDVASEPKPLSYFQNMYGSTYPGLNHYWQEASHGNISVSGSAAHGWYVLPYPRSHYVDGAGNADINALFTDCTQVADPYVYYPSFVGINLMFNMEFGPYAWGGSRMAQLDGVTRVWRVTWEPPWGYGNVCVMSHEMGHGFGFPHSSYNPSVVYDNAWDVMSDTWSYTVSNPTYGQVGQETIAYHKSNLAGWLTSQQRTVIGVGESNTLTLERMADPSKVGVEMIRLPIGGSASHFYTVEARKQVGYDLGTPGSAVIIHEVDTGRTIPALVQGTNGGTGAMGTPGAVFRDAVNNIGVAVLASTSTGFTVAAANGGTMAGSLLGLDAHAATGTSSNLDGVLEPGESAVLEPSWTNVSTGSLSPAGTLSLFTGPAGASYTIADASAAYGAVAPATTRSCWAAGNCYRVTVSHPATRPAVHWDATVVETLSTGSSRTWTLHIGDSFADVPEGFWAYSSVETVLHSGITAGCGGGNYCPGTPVSRWQMAVFLARGLLGDTPPPTSGTVGGQPFNCSAGGASLFGDVPPTDFGCPYIHYIFGEGITAGCGGGNYCPASSTTRDQMAVFLTRTFGLSLYGP